MSNSELERYIQAAHRAGCPADQVGNFLAAGVVLQERQLVASAAARACDVAGGPDQLGYGGARGGGKSHWMLVQMGVDDAQRVPEYKALMLRKVGKALKESFEDMLRKIFYGLNYEYTASRNLLEFPDNGSRILLGHYKNEADIDAYLGLEYDAIGVEEATTLSHGKYKNIRTCNRTSKPGWRPRTYSTTNPGGIGHTWYRTIFIIPARRGKPGPTIFVPATVDDNAFVNVEYRAILDGLTGWQKRAWRFGDWDIAAGQYFVTYRHDVHVIPTFHIPQDWDVWCAMDYGYTHYTVVYLLTKDHDGTIYIADEHRARRWQIKQHADAIGHMLARNYVDLSRLETFVAGSDVFAQKQPGPTIADKYRKLGIKLRPANMDRVNGAAEILARLGDIEARIEPRLYISERCEGLIECLPSLECDPNRPEDVLKVDCDDDGIGGDDPYDAARYGVMAGQSRKLKGGTKRSYSAQQTASEARAARSDDEIDALLDESDDE